jgi:outer membrane receptor for ferrienterochelin and colicins
VVAGCRARSPRSILIAPILLLASLTLANVPRVAAASAHPAANQDTLATLGITVVHNGTPLGGATVRVGGEQRATDAAGRSVLRLAAGLHLVVASGIGFAPDSVAVSLAAGQDTSVTIALEAAAAELEELVVHTTRSTRRLEEQPLRVEVLAQEEVEEKLLMTPGDISMLLNESGGMRVQNTSPSLGGANVRIQGLRGRYSLLLSDGLPLYGGQAGGLGLLQVPPMDLGQVEVIKGASSALYGSSALGGVINLISKQPAGLPAAGARELLFNGTSLGGADAVLFAGGRVNDDLGYTLLAGGHHQDRADRDDDGWTDVPGYERLVVRPRVFWNDGTGRSLFVTGGATLENRDGGTVDGALAPDGTAYAEALTTERFDLGALGRFEVAAGWLLTARLSGMTQQHDHTFGEDLENDRHSTAFGEVSASRSTARTVTVLGLAWQGDWYRNRDLPAFDYDFSVPGVFVHEEWMASERVTLAGSVRLDHHSEYGTFLSPLLSTLVRLGGTWSVRAAAGTGFYGPTPFTEETEVTGLSRLLPLSGLQGEKARSGSVDLGGLLGPFEVNATLFGSAIDRAVQLREAVGGFELFNAEGPTRAYGGELLARYRHAPWHLTASYTYTSASESDPEAPGERREVALTPRHSLGVVGMWEAEGRTRVGLEFYYTGLQSLDDNPYRTTSEPYVILGLLAEQRVGPARLFVNFENILDVRQTKHDPLVLPARAPDGRWTTDAWAPLEGRVVNGGVRLGF